MRFIRSFKTYGNIQKIDKIKYINIHRRKLNMRLLTISVMSKTSLGKRQRYHITTRSFPSACKLKFCSFRKSTCSSLGSSVFSFRKGAYLSPPIEQISHENLVTYCPQVICIDRTGGGEGEFNSLPSFHRTMSNIHF